ncbi:MAG: Nif3-like dinuclear metal center hexameric protein [Clostridia bacterium]|nr:Nif3-like dinuclear metal center hexameric protein [Clostridia bacterium]
MKATEFLQYLKSLAASPCEPTIDTFKAGDAGREVKKVGFCFIATPQVIRAAHEWGADLLVTHEPTYHDHYDNFDPEPVELAKRELLESTGMAVCRFHDHAHAARPDLIHAGFMDKLGVEWSMDERRRAKLKTPLSPYELARLIEKNCKVKHVRITGNRDFKTDTVHLMLGACGDITHIPVKKGETKLVVCGETCEWKCLEYVRDAAELGFECAILTLGHVGSERDGMEYIARKAREDTGLETVYFEAGEVYSYTEDEK